MTKRNGLHWRMSFSVLAVICMLLVPTTLVAEERAEDIVAMLNWWDDYGRFWDEVNADVSAEDFTVFSLANDSTNRKTLATNPSLALSTTPLEVR